MQTSAFYRLKKTLVAPRDWSRPEPLPPLRRKTVMSEFEVLVWAFLLLATLATFIVMLMRRPGEITKEKFEKRDW